MKRCQGSHTAPCLATAAVEARQPGDLFKASQRVSCDTVSSATLQLPNSTVHSRLTASYGRCTASTHSLVPCLLRCVLADSECPLSGVKHGLKCLTLSVLVISIPLPITTNLRVPGAAHTCTPHHLRLSHPMHHPSSSPLKLRALHFNHALLAVASVAREQRMSWAVTHDRCAKLHRGSQGWGRRSR